MPRGGKISAVESSVGAQLKTLVRAQWAARTNVGNRRDAERLREIEGVVGLLPQHVWKDPGEWYVHPRARDARIQTWETVAKRDDEKT
jgi:hypothetical protein